MEKVIKIDGMTCDHCKSTVEGALNKLDGVQNAAVDLKNANVIVDYNEDKVTIEDMHKAIEDQGYDVEKN